MTTKIFNFYLNEKNEMSAAIYANNLFLTLYLISEQPCVKINYSFLLHSCIKFCRSAQSYLRRFYCDVGVVYMTTVNYQ